MLNICPVLVRGANPAHRHHRLEQTLYWPTLQKPHEEGPPVYCKLDLDRNYRCLGGSLHYCSGCAVLVTSSVGFCGRKMHRPGRNTPLHY